MRYEIIVEVNGKRSYLDTYDYEPVSLTYNIADVRDISNRNTSYSKTITVPETPNNKQVFGFISDLSSDSTFNPNKKSPVWILCDTVPVLTGNIQLTNINTDFKTGETKFECVVYSETDNFFKEMGDLYLTDLDFSDLNHQFTPANVKATWTASNTYKIGYYYPLIDYGNGWTFNNIYGGPVPGSGITGSTSGNIYNTSVDLIDMKPSTYVRRIWDKIFTETGYQYQSSFLDSELFNNLIIPSNADEIYSTTGSTPFSIGLNTNYSAGYPGRFVGSSTYSTLPLINTTGVYNVNSQFTTSGGILTKVTDDITYRLNLSFNFRHKCYVDSSPADFSDYTRLIVTIYREKNPITGAVDPTWNSGLGYVIDQPFVIETPVWKVNSSLQFERSDSSFVDGQWGQVYGTQSGNDYYNDFYLNLETSNLDDTIPSRAKINNGDKIRVVVTTQRWKNSSNQLGSSGAPSYELTIYANNTANLNYDTFLYSDFTSKLLCSYGTMDYNTSIPKKVKQKEFITSIIRMFNLYIEPSKQWRKTLVIEPRDDYYASGEIKDWTNKIDLNSPIDIKPISDLQSKQIILKYKDDNDYLNLDYKSKTNESYGQYIYDVDNDFINDVKTIETIFSSTPLSEVSGSG